MLMVDFFRAKAGGFEEEVKFRAALAKIHLTDRPRDHVRSAECWPPNLKPEYALVGVKELAPDQVEIHVQPMESDPWGEEYEWIFTCKKDEKQDGEWRIDSAVNRIFDDEEEEEFETADIA